MIGWILLAVAIGLFLLGLVRESFEPTQSIKAPPYDAAEKVRVFNMVRQRSATPPYAFLGYQDILLQKAEQQLPNEKNRRKLEEAAGGLVTPAIEAFFNTVFKPATTPITKEQVKAFVDARPSDIKMIEEDVLTTYFVGQSGVGTSERSGYAATLAAMGQNAGYLISNAPEAAGPSAGSAAAAASTETAADAAAAADDATTGSGTTGGATTGSGTSGSGTTGGATTGSGTTGGGATTGSGTTGGGSGSGTQVYGPTFTSLGSPIHNNGGDSTRTNQYPELMGGMGGDARNRDLLPSSASLGSDPNSGYFPYSRTPGDQDLIPDPYRLNRNYSTASYSSKTDPVPFLTDFSAFSK